MPSIIPVKNSSSGEEGRLSLEYFQWMEGLSGLHLKLIS
jgi:hypothetical protein